MEIFKSNGSLCNLYPDLLKTSFTRKMNKNKAIILNEHLLNAQNGNLQVKLTIL